MAAYIRYEVDARVATITLDRPEARNAQNQQFLEELDACWMRAAEDEAVRVILLRAEGKHFSAGHDVSPEAIRTGPFNRIVETIPERGLLGIHEWEARFYLNASRRWRDVPKPSIAAVQGACIAGGLLLAWPCDLIVAADDAYFSDPVVLMGIGGVEYHGHTWEVGPRKAKEMLFTARPVPAIEAERRGMVNRVVARDALEAEARDLATEIARMHPHALAMAKRAVNQTLDVMGQGAALQSCFDIHQLGHASAFAQTGQFIVAGVDKVKAHK